MLKTKLETILCLQWYRIFVFLRQYTHHIIWWDFFLYFYIICVAMVSIFFLYIRIDVSCCVLFAYLQCHHMMLKMGLLIYIYTFFYEYCLTIILPSIWERVYSELLSQLLRDETSVVCFFFISIYFFLLLSVSRSGPPGRHIRIGRRKNGTF